MKRGQALSVFLMLFAVASLTTPFVAVSSGVVENDMVETRYMTIERHEVNGLNAFKLETAKSPGDRLVEDCWPGWLGEISWGIRIWKRLDNGTEVELTAGTPVARVCRHTLEEGLQNATWDCPETLLDGLDSIVIRVYVTPGEGEDQWSKVANFTTQQLGAFQLDSAKWTVYYYTSLRFVYPSYNGEFYWGYNYASRIENFQYSKSEIPEYPSMIVVLFFLSTTLLAVIICKRKRTFFRLCEAMQQRSILCTEAAERLPEK